MKLKKWIAASAVLCLAAAAAGCSKEAAESPAGSSAAVESESASAAPEESRGPGGPAGETHGESGYVPAGPGGSGDFDEFEEQETFDYEFPGWENQSGAGEGKFPGDGADFPDETAPEEEPAFVQQKIVVATDMHYLAEELAGNRGETFMTMVRDSDGRVLQYGWEVMDAFLEDVLEEQPDLVVLSGDLTLNGEKKSHEELAEKLSILTDNDIEVAVIPGNHDINYPHAVAFTEDGEKPVESITAEEFAEIYADYGYTAADSRDPNSLSYLYKLDDYYWLLMLDSCQYEPANQVGGMIQRGTYRWIEEVLEESWEQGAQIISVSHHNLLDQSGVSREFYDDCTIEHHEELLELLAGYEVRLHMSGHLHLQHYIQDEEYGIYEIVTGSLVMAPCQYGVLRIWNDGNLQYDARETDVSGWAKRNGYKNNQALTNFKSYCANFLAQVSYGDALEDLKHQFFDRHIFISDTDMKDMARFYAELCVYYFGGRMYEIADRVKTEEAYKKWDAIEYASDLSDFLKNILEDEEKDFGHLMIPY